jgi:hypothetical protein
MEESLPVRYLLKFYSTRGPMACPRCAIKVRRTQRRGLLQKHVLPLFGFFPWECPVCREPIFFRKRDKQRSYPRTAQP